MDCPFCRRTMRRGRLRSRGYATVWTPDEARVWLPAPYDAIGRRRRNESVVVGNFGTRSALRCDGCGAVVMPPEGQQDAG